MSRFNTGNPIDSDDPRDRSDNTRNLDDAMHSDTANWTDRFGEKRLTWREIERGIKDQLIAGGMIFPDEPTGREAVDDGQYFYAQGENSSISKALYRRESSSSSTLIAVEPTATYLNAQTDMAIDVASTTNNAPSEFHSSEGDNISFAIIDQEGNQLASWDKAGIARQGIAAEFFTEESSVQPMYTLADENGYVLLSVDSDGHVNTDTNSSANLYPYVRHGEWRATSERDYLIAGIPEGYLLSTYPKNQKTVIGVVNVPSIGDTTLVQAGISGGLAVPCSKNVLHVILGVGQSLMTGGRAQDSLVSVEAEFPEKALMLDTGPESDVRFSTALEEGVINTSKVTGFTAMRAVASGLNGETPMESCLNTSLQRMRSSIGTIAGSYLVINGGKSGTAYEGLKKGTQPYINMMLALQKAIDIAQDMGLTVIVEAVLHKHGEGDALSLTYYDDLMEWQADISSDVQSMTGQQKQPPFIMAQPSGWTTSTPTAALSMLRAHVESPYHWLSGSDYPYADKYDIERDDFTHFTGPGYYLIGEKMSDAFVNLSWKPPGSWDVVRIKSATRVGATVELSYSVPIPPLRIDTTLITPRDVLGYRYVVDGQDVEIAGAHIQSDGTDGMDGVVVLTLASEPIGAKEEVYYAMGPATDPRSIEGQPRGNIRDSSPSVSRLDQRPLYNWGVHQVITVITGVAQ